MGPHNPTLDVNDVHNSQYDQETDTGPIDGMGNHPIEDALTGKTVQRKRTKKELVAAMMADDPSRQPPNGNYKRLVELAASHVPPIPAYQLEATIMEGWKGKAKGIVHILLERGLIDRFKHTKDI